MIIDQILARQLSNIAVIVKIITLGICIAIISGCSSRSGGYYKDDGPHASVPANIAAIPDAEPRVEQHKPANFRPYTVFGVNYMPIGENQSYRKQGIASWYGKKFHGQKTANGETYDMYSMTAAHPTLPLPSYAKVTRPANGRTVIVRINDRGPFHSDRIIDLSYAAAAKLGIIGPGSDTVIVEAITNNDILAGNYKQAKTTPVSIPSTKSYINTPNLENIYLQFGAFASSTNAQAMAERISRTSGIFPEIAHQSDLYKVRLGPYGDRNEANLMAEQLQGYDLQPTIAIDIDI